MDILIRFWTDLIGRMGGPFSFRFLLQPTVAFIYALRDGTRDAHEGRPPYLSTIIRDPAMRRPLLREGTKAVTRVMVLGVVMDAAYQLIVFRVIYPMEMLVMVALLAFVPYLLLRGPINRLVARRLAKRIGAP